MRKVLAIVLVAIFVMSFAVTGMAADAPAATKASSVKSGTGEMAKAYPPGPIQKAERGFTNMLFGWTEIPKRIVDKTKEYNNPIKGLLLGAFQGTCKGVARTASGAFDVATFPVGGYEKPAITPDMPAAE